MTCACSVLVTSPPPVSLLATVEHSASVLYAPTGPQGPQGPQGPTGTVIPASIGFQYGDVSPVFGVTIAAGQRVMECRLIIETPFDGVGAALSIGDSADHQSLLATTQVNPAMAGGYFSVPLVKYAAATALNLYLTPGTDPHQGAGQFFIFVEG